MCESLRITSNTGINDGTARESNGIGVRNRPQRHGYNTDRVSKRNLRDERGSNRRRRVLDSQILPILSNRISNRPVRVLWIHDVSAEESAPVLGGSEFDFPHLEKHGDGDGF